MEIINKFDKRVFKHLPSVCLYEIIRIHIRVFTG